MGELTKLERQIAILAGSGMSSKDIASKLDLSPKTVGNYLTFIYNKEDIEGTKGEFKRIKLMRKFFGVKNE